MSMEVWWVLCVMAWAGGGGGGGGARAEISQNMNNLSRNLQQEMADVMEMVEVNYSTPLINTTYRASVEFDMRAMGPLYNSTHLVIDFIANKQLYPEGIVSVSDGHLELAPLKENWKPLLAHYAGPVAVLVIAVLLVAALPLAGLFWCCCYWCRVGRRRRPFDRKYDACLKGLLAIILIAILTLFQFGVVCLFATESQLESGAAEAPATVRTALRDAQEFLNATQAHARWLLVVNYNELATKLNAALVTSGTMVSMKLSEFNRAVSVTTLNSLVLKLDSIHEDLVTVRELTKQLRALADQLNSGLRKVKNHLLQTLANCDQRKCIELQNKYNIGQLNTEIQYNQMLDKYFPTMPDVTDLVNNVSALLNGSIKAEVGAGQQVFRDIQAGIRRSVQEHIPDVQAAIADTGRRLEALADEITAGAGELSARLQRQAVHADELQRLQRQYGPYRRYLGLAAAVAPLLITCLLAWGLACGVYGKRPDAYGASDCCNKGHGSRALLCGVGAIFLLGGAMALVLAAYFLVGVLAQRAICDPLTEPRDNRVFSDVELVVDLERVMFNERKDPGFNLSSVLLDCHANHTIYKTLQLRRRLDVGGERAAARRGVRARVAALRPAAPARAAILREGARRQLRALADSGLGEFRFDRVLDALDTNLTSLALDALARQLDSTAAALRPAQHAEARALREAAGELRRLLADVLDPMMARAGTLNSTALRLRESVRLGRGSLREAISYLMQETAEAERFLSTQGPARLQNITREYGGVIADKLDEYLARVEHAALHDVGRCGPLSNAYNATRDAACRNVLMPLNGYWMSLAWCVALFVPLVLVAQRLARLYLHADPYPGPLVEAEYLYDAYADRDNVPLANAYKAEKRSGRTRGAREGEAAGGGGGGGGAGGGGARGGGSGGGAGGEVAPPLDTHHARRYNDMAPKHWEEGPPRYLGPTEYERPPPYYYPGPNDRQ